VTADRDMTLDDRRAREDARDVSQSFIVQAPAGSGKTELLIQRFLCLLATVENPEEVLAITFTRKAANEMRLRVILALQRAARGERAEEDHEQVTADAAARVLARDEERHWELIDNPRRLRIQTLDSLNAAIARMQPLTSGASTGTALVDMGQMNALYRQAAAATLDWIGDGGDVGRATEEVLLHVDNNTGIYISYLSQMLQTRDQWLPFVSTGLLNEDEARTLRSRFETSLQKIVKKHLRSLSCAFPVAEKAEFFELARHAAGNLQEEGKADNVICELSGIAALPEQEPESLPTWNAIAELLLKKDGDIRKQIDKRIGFPADNKAMKARMADQLQSLGTETEFVQLLHAVRLLPPISYTDEQWSVLLSLFRLLPIAVAELQRLSLGRGVTDYIEIALSAGTALGTADEPGDIALLLDYQLRHILIDEMQDTSKAQYRMLEALTAGWQAGDERTLFCVGDPMQSIYRFRNAEVAQFLFARDGGLGDVSLSPLILRRNFRSGEHLVHWFNTIFPLVLSDHDDPANGAVSYAEAVPVDKFAGQGDVELYPVIGSDKDLEAAQSFSIIEKTLSENPDDSMAVLVRGRSHLPSLLLRLREAGIPYQAVDIDRLTDLPEIIDVMALTRAFSHLGDRVAWLGLLRSPWAGLSWDDLHQLVFERDHQTVWECLIDEKRIADLSTAGREITKRFRTTVEAFLVADRSTSLCQRVESAWFHLGGPGALNDKNAIANVYRFFEVLATLEVGGTLTDIVRLQELLDSEYASTNESSRLQIMTMHKAKGLQFDHVLLHGLGRYPRPPTPAVMSWFDLPNAHGGEEKIISPVGRRDELTRDRVHQFIERTESYKDAHETGRLLYVACTRARKSLHLVGHTEIARDGESLRKPQSKTLLSLLWPAVEAQFQDALITYQAPITGDDDTQWVEPVLRRFEKPWELPALNPIPGQSLSGENEDAVSYKVDYYWVGADARLAGTVVHRWLQLATDGKIALHADNLDSLSSSSRRWLRELGAGDDALDSICERIFAALNGVLSHDKGRWLLQGDGAAELALSGQVNGRIESIVIDRIRIDDDGSHWIVDYKTSTHEGGNMQEFLRAECDRYRGQLRKYARIYGDYSGARLRCALYFPLLREFVEVEI
jgi:ATP-dependent helicase/nuclease subunit A